MSTIKVHYTHKMSYIRH